MWGINPGTGEFPTEIASNAENDSIWRRHHVKYQYHEIHPVHKLLWCIVQNKNETTKIIILYHKIVILYHDFDEYIISLQYHVHSIPRYLYGINLYFPYHIDATTLLQVTLFLSYILRNSWTSIAE